MLHGQSTVLLIYMALVRMISKIHVIILIHNTSLFFFLISRFFHRTILPVQNMLVSLFSSGEGWHNYHHAFPWDYRASEFGTPFNFTGMMLDIFAKFGWVYDLRQATDTMVKHRVFRTGDESHNVYGTDEGKKSTKTLFNIFNHPLNPTYNSIHKPQAKVIEHNGYALIENELNKNDLDESFLTKETDIIRQQKSELNVETGIKKYIIDKKDAVKVIGPLSKFLNDDSNNNLENNVLMDGVDLTINNNLRERKPKN